MGLAVDLSDGSGWGLSYQELFEAEVVSQLPSGVERYKPIPKQILSPTFSSRLLVVGCTSTKAHPRWKLGGRLTPVFDCGDAPFIYATYTPTWVPLDDNLLWFLPGLTATFRLKFEVPFWLQESRLSIYEFQGHFSENSDDLIHDWLLPR